MYFKRLELVGFKSFCEKTILHFEPGITAVVGPNGCGKSNLYDSIRWVLGEQSVKALRGSDMQDVIFNGTDLKEPLGMAEATLVFDNKNKYLNIDHDEVAITRRIFRSGESEYLLNKTQVRLKDILDLLMGTGIGAESYSLVPQGKIELVLSSKPEDRRIIFDEAAGITKYKAQKKEALRKLEETEQNLLRVNDIVLEVKRQIGSLERQANKARRYKEVFEELKSKEINLAWLQKKELLSEKEGIANSLKELEVRQAQLLNTIKEQESLVSSCQEELKAIEDNINRTKEGLLNLENLVTKDRQQISLNQERIIELETTQAYLLTQIEQAKARLLQEEEKFNRLKEENNNLNKNIAEKSLLLKNKETQLNQLNSGIKLSLEKIAAAKRNILELVTKIAHLKNTSNELIAQKQIHLARQKRLEIEKLKVNEEKLAFESNLNQLNQEIASLEKDLADLNSKISNLKAELESAGLSLKTIVANIEEQEKERLTKLAQKEFLGKLKTEYEGIDESMNALIYLDKLPQEKISGLLIKVNENNPQRESAGFKLTGEAKPIDLDTEKISEKIREIEHKIAAFRQAKQEKETQIEELNKEIEDVAQDLRNQEINLADKKANLRTIEEQFNKIKAEAEIIILELAEVENELSGLERKIIQCQSELRGLEKEETNNQDLISDEQNNIAANNKLKEETLVILAKVKTELEVLNRRIDADQVGLKSLEFNCNQDKENLVSLQTQASDSLQKSKTLTSEITDLENEIQQANKGKQDQMLLLKEAEDKHQQILNASKGTLEKIELDRKESDALKNKLYELQVENKELEFKYLNLRERMQQAYKIDLDILELPGTPVLPVKEQTKENILLPEIEKLKEKLDSYGTVNLVAIEEYDELKKRYDFLTQQQNDLVSAKDSLQEVIQKINRTTKKMFLETLEKVRLEFRNYFRLLFGGGDAQIFLIDESDPLESGIEIICRPLGKKLQNVLLLSGGEKALAAIALIFAIFKIKPVPFCVLDEIDAALDEANIDRFGRLLKEFTQDSQFIVITHNKRTIATADIMYGITMEESGVSKIVSVKFAKTKVSKDKEKKTDASVVGEPV